MHCDIEGVVSVMADAVYAHVSLIIVVREGRYQSTNMVPV
jgi:hypothetical protein